MLDASFLDPAKFYHPATRSDSMVVDHFVIFDQWREGIDFFARLMPSLDKAFQSFSTLVEEQKLQDHFYLNYAVADIDWECVLLTSYFHFLSGQESSSNSIGLGLGQFKSVAEKIDFDADTLFSDSQMEKRFLDLFGIEKDKYFVDYFKALLKESVEGYDFSKMTDDEFRHVGGPLILNQN